MYYRIVDVTSLPLMEDYGLLPHLSEQDTLQTFTFHNTAFLRVKFCRDIGAH